MGRPSVAHAGHRDFHDICPAEVVRLANTNLPAELEAIRDRLPILMRPGKLLRARMVAASACLGDAVPENEVNLAALGIELIHEGSLIHDDICDGSPARRGLPSVPVRWGPRGAAWIGTAMFGWGLELLGALARRRQFELDLGFAVEAAEAQIFELLPWDGEPEQQRRRYERVVRGKTGALFALACDVGAQLSRLARAERDVVARFANAVALGFQVLDDVRDVEGQPLLGKPGGGDLARGIVTWPVIEWLAGSSRTTSCARIEDLATWREILTHTGALARSREFAVAQHGLALEALSLLPKSRGRERLAALALECCGV